MFHRDSLLELQNEKKKKTWVEKQMNQKDYTATNAVLYFECLSPLVELDLIF